jgi:hypothetical protein
MLVCTRISVWEFFSCLTGITFPAVFYLLKAKEMLLAIMTYPAARSGSENPITQERRSGID